MLGVIITPNITEPDRSSDDQKDKRASEEKGGVNVQVPEQSSPYVLSI